MRSDLQGLEITKGELKHLTGVSIGNIFQPPTLNKFLQEFIKTLLIVVLVCLSCFLLIHIFPEYKLLLFLVHTGAALGLLIDDFKKISFSKKHQKLLRLFDEVEHYNAVIKAIDINDQIEVAGNPGVKIQDRDKVIIALKLTREDLVRALKTERILRENDKFIKMNPDLFANNLKALTALQVSHQASEHGRLLNEALQIAIDVQEEMRQLNNGRLDR